MKRKLVFFIADDDPDDQEIFIKALQETDEDCICLTAKDGTDAIEKLLNEKIQPDFIFLDLNMPKSNGKDCLKEIKNIEFLKNIPVIIFSTTANEKEVQEVMQFGAHCFLQKPNRFGDLCVALNRLILHTNN